ncbi:MAG: hypothetical protein P8127_12180, partial [Acidobacteriota bacterium]
AQPDQEALPSTTPKAVTRLIERCTEKDPRRRLRDIGEARIALEDARADSGETVVETGEETPKPGFSRWLPWIATAGAVLVALVMTLLYVQQTDAPDPTVGRFAVEYPYTQGQRYGDGRALAISPDGNVIVTSAAGGSDDLLYYRRIDEYEAHQVTAARAGRLPFFSPDGEWIGFVTPQGVWKINLAGGPPTKLGSVTAFTVGATWSTNGSIYLTSSQQLWQLPENGGESERIDIEGFGSEGVGNPWAMPSGKTLLLSVGQRDDANLIALDLETKSIREIGLQGSDPRYLPTGHLIYTHANQVLAVKFDARDLAPIGTPIPVLPRVRIDSNTMQLAFSDNGTAVYLPADERGWRRLVMVDLNGRADPVFEESTPFSDNNDPMFSPDGSKIALSESAGPIWVIDLESGAPIKLSDSGFYPMWSPDGSQIAYGTARSTSFDLMLRPLDMSQPERVLLDRDINLRTADWAQDGALIIREEIPGKGMDLMRWADLQDESSIGVLLGGDADEVSPAVSPNGRWLAYVSGQSGRDEVYVAAYPKPEGVVQVSVAGGANPAWSADGSEIYYFQGREFIAVTVAADRGLRVVGRRTLFESDIRQYRWHRQYDVHPDGQHFVMIEDPPGGHLEVILNWFTELEQTLDRKN